MGTAELPEHRCRLCTANDREALIEEVAQQMWDRHRGTGGHWPWADVHGYWRTVFLGFAEDIISVLGKQ